MNVFLLEDDEAIGIGLKYSLENEGYTVTIATSVKSAFEIINKEKFALYILDLTLPDGSVMMFLLLLSKVSLLQLSDHQVQVNQLYYI